MKMSLEVVLIIAMVIILAYLSLHYAGTIFAPVTKQNSQNQVCFGQNCFSVELAKTEMERAKGLMYRTQMDKDKGMLFIFDSEGDYPFWMKNTLIPLDMVWIDQNFRVVFIGQNIQPCKSLICPFTDPKVDAKYVVELNAGISSQIGLKVGDRAKINIIQ